MMALRSLIYNGRAEPSGPGTGAKLVPTNLIEYGVLTMNPFGDKLCILNQITEPFNV